MKVLTTIAYGTAIALAAFSGSVATYGLTKFAGGNHMAELVIAVMGLLFEAGKLTAFALLHKQMPRWLKAALLFVGLVLMSLNIAGVSGFLSSYYEKQDIAAHAVNQTAEVDASSNVAELERRMKVAEAGVEKVRDHLGKARDSDQIRSLNKQIEEAKKEREAIAGQLRNAQRQKARAAGSAIEATGEFAAVVYFAETFHTDQRTVVHYVFLCFGCLPDVLAVLLLLAAGYASRQELPVTVTVVEEPPVVVEPEPETIEPQVVVEEPVTVENVPQLTPAQISARKGAETKRIKALVLAAQRKIATRKGQATKKRNKKAKAKAATARAAGLQLVTKK